MGCAVIEVVKLEEHLGLADYERHVTLAQSVRDLRSEAGLFVPQLAGRKVWMLNSTAAGGGVAEMMPRIVSLLRELGVETEWAVMRPARPEFFALTKRLHNLIHGEGDPALGPSDRELYDSVSRECADSLRPLVRPSDLLVVHDPQPLGTGAMLKSMIGVRAIWRCHIGLEEDSEVARAAWAFLQRYAAAYDHFIFSAPEYIRDFVAGRATVMRPTIDPLSHKNRELPPHKLVGVLCNSGLITTSQPLLTPPFEHPALRLQPDGAFARVEPSSDPGLLFRPIVTQVSRWDRLKGFVPLLQGFGRLKQRLRGRTYPPRQQRRLQILRLVLAGPEPGSVEDDPEARQTLAEVVAAFRALEAKEREDVAVFALPLESVKNNALMVNALQRCSTIVVQNSLREGFGLTATEAMWKGVPVLGTHAWGLRQQIRDGLDGRLVKDANDAEEIAQTLDEMLADPAKRFAWAQSGQRRVHDESLVFGQVRDWLRVLAAQANGANPVLR